MRYDDTQVNVLKRLGKSPDGQQLIALIQAEIAECNGTLRKSTGEGLLREQGKALWLDEYGAGTLVTDSSGNVTASSDSRMKTNVADWNTGLDKINALRPVSYNWNEASGLNTADLNVGLIAQDVINVIPEAIGHNTNTDTYTLIERPILMALVNAVQALSTQVTDIQTRLTALESKVGV